MLNRLVLPFLVAGSVLAASQPSETLRPPDLNQLSKDQFQQLLSKALSGPTEERAAAQRGMAAQARGCSIPLLEAKVEHPERFNMPKLRGGRKNLDRMAVPPPAPACRGWDQGQ
jgi:hypothetical protein